MYDKEDRLFFNQTHGAPFVGLSSSVITVIYLFFHSMQEKSFIFCLLPIHGLGLVNVAISLTIN